MNFRSSQGAECSKCEKPCRSSVDSIAKVTFWPSFLLNSYEERHNTSCRGTADVRLHTCMSRQFRGYISLSTRKVKDGTHSNQVKQQTGSTKSSCRVLHKHLPKYKLSDRKLFQSLFQFWRAFFNFSGAHIFR